MFTWVSPCEWIHRGSDRSKIEKVVGGLSSDGTRSQSESKAPVDAHSCLPSHVPSLASRHQ